jgi:hypothetical protein
MKLAALRYSPEIAEAFHPTLTDRPATKKSDAVRALRAAQNPIQIVRATVTPDKATTQKSSFSSIAAIIAPISFILL